MYVAEHARGRLVQRLGADLGLSIVADLEAMKGTAGNEAILVAVLPEVIDLPGSNGNQVIVIARGGSVETVMLRRSWNQPFTSSALGVDRCTKLC